MHSIITKFLLLLWLSWAGRLPCALAESRSLLADAVEQRDSATTNNLLALKVDPNEAQADGMTPLLWASYYNDLTTSQRLIEAGADPRLTNRYGITPLSLACTNGNAALVKLLLKKGADPNTTQSGGETVLMIASRTGRLDVVEALLSAGAKVDVAQRNGQTALMWASAEGHADVVDCLINAGAECNTTLRSGFTPLFFAVRNGHIAVAKRLLAEQVDVNAAMTEVRAGRGNPDRNTSPLMLAMENGHFELAEVLLKAGANPNDDRTGFAPLHAMSWIRKPEKGDNETGTPPPKGSGTITSLQFVRLLVTHGADVNFRKRSNGGGRLRISVQDTTPFLCAAATADVAYMQTLLELGADPTAMNRKSQTALMMAAGIDEKPEGDGPATKAEHLAAVRYLLDLGGLADQNIDATDVNGETAMHGAAYKSLPEVVSLLDERGADINIWNRPTKQGRTPLSIARGYRPGNFKPSFETEAAIEKVMVAHGVTPPPPPKRADDGWDR